MRLLALSMFAVLLLACDGGGSPSGKDADASAPAGPTKVSLQLNWYPEAEHGGFYAALVHGYYRDAGLEVEIVGGGVDVPVIPLVASGKREFGVCNADEVILGRSEGANVVALMAPIQTSPRCIMVHEESGIDSFDDMRDMTVAMSARSPFAAYLQSKFEFPGVRFVGYAGVAPFAADPKYAMQGYNFSEPFVARGLGAKPRVLMVSDVSFNPYTSVLVASDTYVDANDDVARRMTEASAKGWAKYLAEPDETNRHIHGLNAEMGLDNLSFGVEQLRPLSLTEETKTLGVGCMTRERWTTIARQLEELKLVEPGKVRPETAFSTKYLPTP